MKLHQHLSLLTLALAALLTPVAHAADYEPKVGLQTWTCRGMKFDEVVAFAEKHQLKYIQVIGSHIDPNGAPEESKRKQAVLAAKGLTCYTFGVAGTSPDKEKNRKLFEFAKLMGIKVIVVEPKNDAATWDSLEELVKEYDIKLAIHNHGKDSVYGTPEKVWSVLKSRDKRIGVCMDVGHLTGAGFDAAKAFRDYEGRVYDIHLKDKKTEKTADGKTVILDVMVGTGDSNYKGLLAELKTAKWDGVMAIETDNGTFAKEPTEFVTGAVKYVKKPSQRPETIQYKQERQWKTEELRRALKGKSKGGVVATLGKPTKQVGDDVWYYKPFTTTDSDTGKVFSYIGVSFFSDGTVGNVQFFE